MGTVVINGVPLACSRNPPLQINGQKVWSPDININGQMITGVNINGYDYPPAPAGSVLYLPGLPGQGSTIWDRSDKGNNGAITGATWTWLPSGLPVLSFDGNDRIVITHNTNQYVGAAFTIMVWTYPTSFGGSNYGNIISKDNNASVDSITQGYKLSIYKSGGTTGRFECGISHATTNALAKTTTDAIVLNKNYFLVAVYNEDADLKIKMYINGSLSGLSTNTAGVGAVVNSTNNLTIGTNSGLSLVYWTGKLNMECLIPSALTAAQVANDYAQTRSLFGV